MARALSLFEIKALSIRKNFLCGGGGANNLLALKIDQKTRHVLSSAIVSLRECKMFIHGHGRAYNASNNKENQWCSLILKFDTICLRRSKILPHVPKKEAYSGTYWLLAKT